MSRASTYDPLTWPGDTRPLWQRAKENRWRLGFRHNIAEAKVAAFRKRAWQAKGGRKRMQLPDAAEHLARIQALSPFTSQTASRAAHLRWSRVR